MTEIKRCKVCGVTLCRDNAVMKGKHRNKLGNICHYCEQNRVREARNRNKKIIDKNKKERLTEALGNPRKCSFCSEAIGISPDIENKISKTVLNCCAKCDNEKNNKQNIYTTIGRGSSPRFIIKFESHKEKYDFVLWRNLQISFSGTAYGTRTSKVGQNTYEILRHEDEDGNITYTTETRICDAEKIRPDGSRYICGGELRYDKHEVLYCEKCQLCY